MSAITIRCLLIILISGICSTLKAQADTVLVKKADSLAIAKKTEDAIVLYTRAIRLNPKNEKAYRGRGRSYMEQNKFKLAESDYKIVLQLNPKCSNCLANMGLIKLSLNDTVAAIKYADDAVKADDKNSFGYEVRGKINFFRDKNSEAIIDFNKAINLDSMNAEAFYFRALVFIKMEEYEKGVNDLSATIRLAPSFANAWYQRGIYFANKQQWSEALSNFSKAASLDSNNSNYQTNIANVYLYKNELAEASRYYTKAINLDKNNYEAIFYRAAASYRMENMDASCEDLKILKSRLPAKIEDEQLQALKDDMAEQLTEYCDSIFSSYYYQRGVAAYNLNQFEKAIEWYDKGLRKFPDSYMMNDFKGNAFLALERYTEAEESYTKAISLQRKLEEEVKQSRSYKNETSAAQQLFVVSTVCFTYADRAEAKSGYGNYKAALEDADAAFKIMPDAMMSKENIFNTKGIIYLRMNDNGNALSNFNKAIQINPDFSSAYVNRAMVKINLAFKTKIVVASFGIQNRNISTQFDIPALRKETINKDNLEAALSDCNKAIQANDKNENAWQIRATVKLLLGEGDYCYDLLKAERLGSSRATQMIAEYKCR